MSRREDSERAVKGSRGRKGKRGKAGAVYVYSRERMREVDRLCTEEFGIPSILLMENAAVGLAREARAMLDRQRGRGRPGWVLVFVGPGNNGGDGLAVARHLHNEGVRVGVVLVADEGQPKGDAATNLGIAERMGLSIERVTGRGVAAAVAKAVRRLGKPHLVCDALLGTGVNRAVEGNLAAAIGAINELRRRGAAVLAVDIPSGLDADSGRPAGRAAGPCVVADRTVTLGGLKSGFLAAGAGKYLGEVVIAPIGAPTELLKRLGRRGRIPE